MTTISAGHALLNRRAISALAKTISDAQGIAHAAAIDIVAKSLGFTGGNALMGALKNSEDGQSQTPMLVPASRTDKDALAVTPTQQPPAGYLYHVSFYFVTDGSVPMDLSLAQIEEECDTGGCVGQMLHPIESCTPIDQETLGKLASHFGSTPSFFPCFDDADDIDDDN